MSRRGELKFKDKLLFWQKNKAFGKNLGLHGQFNLVHQQNPEMM